MMRCPRCLLTIAVTAMLLLPLSACVLLGDIFNPDFISAIGIDPGTILPQSGTIAVVFSNETSSPAVFQAFEQSDAQDPTLGARNFGVEVPAGEKRNEILSCPVGLISFGQIDASYSVTTVAANVLTNAGGTTQIDYTGAALESGSEYTCGDVINARLVDSATTDGGYDFIVEILRGS